MFGICCFVSNWPLLSCRACKAVLPLKLMFRITRAPGIQTKGPKGSIAKYDYSVHAGLSVVGGYQGNTCLYCHDL